MPASQDSRLLHLIRRVQRRLTFQQFGNILNLLCPAALVVLGVVFLVVAKGKLRLDAWALESETFLVRVAWIGGSVGLVLLISTIIAWRRRPSARQAALLIDEAFSLQERVSTCLEMRSEEAASAAGQALLVDTMKHVESVQVQEAYPLNPSRLALLVPVAGTIALLAALFCDVVTPQTNANTEPVTPALKAELEKASRDLREMTKEKPLVQSEKAPKGEAFKKLLEELKTLSERQPATKEEARELLKDMTALEDRLRKQKQAMAERTAAMKKQSEEADRLRKKKPERPSPTEQALKQGDLSKASEELQRLSREMAKEGLTPEQRETMEKEMQDLRDHLDRLADVKEKDAKEREKDGAKDQDPTDAEQMKEMDAAEVEALREMAEDLKEIEKAIKEGKEKEAAEKLHKLARKMGQLDPNGKQEEAARRLAQLQSIKERLGRQMGNQPAQASGKRPEKPQEDLKGQETKAKSERKDGGIGGYRLLPGVGLREPRSTEQVQKLIDEAGREAAEAILRQRVQRGDAPLTKGYFEKLRGDKK